MTENANNIIDYDKLVENSLRYVIKQTLEIVEEQGLPGEHHFYITFLTKKKGVVIPKVLLESYPKEMTIVVQHQFYDLKVNEEGFSITLSFNNVPHNLTVPYDAVTYFADPYAKFGLKFNVEDETAVEEDNINVKKETKENPLKEEGSAKVVALDAFRKK